MYQTDFTPDEFRARRQKLCELIGPEAHALVPGAPGPKGGGLFHQYKDFYYLSGLETPRGYLLIEGRTGRTTAYLPHESQVQRESPRPVASVETANLVSERTGVDAVLGWEDLAQGLNHASVVYVPFDDGQPRGVNRHNARSWAASQSADPWDTRLTRAAQFIETVRRQFPRIEIRDLTGLMDEMRLVKSPTEVDLLRRAGHLAAVGVIEAMRSTCPGVMEYQLDAVMRYHYVAGGASGRAYSAIVAGGANAYYGHYFENTSALLDGDLVLGDCAPDYHEYVSDIGRMWPVNGTYTPTQRAIYGFVVEYHKVLLDLIRPGCMVADLHAAAAEKMKAVLADWPFATTAHRATAQAMFDFRGHISHCVGMTVHDGSLHRTIPLAPGMVFSVDPQFHLPDENLYYRVEDTIVITEDGLENLTAAAPLELDDVEALMQQDGMIQSFPPT